MLEEMHDPVLSQPICHVRSETPLLSSEKFVHGHFCYSGTMWPSTTSVTWAEAADYFRKTYLGV